MEEEAVIQLMQQLQVDKQAKKQAVVQQQRHLDLRQEAEQQQMRRVKAMVVNTARQGWGLGAVNV